jgi:hypothetical protein
MTQRETAKHNWRAWKPEDRENVKALWDAFDVPAEIRERDMARAKA